MRYYRRHWDDDPGGRQSSWGRSDWFFEVDDSGVVLRQVERYECGPKLRYDDDTPEDEHGGRSVEPLAEAEWRPYLIAAHEFEAAWRGEP